MRNVILVADNVKRKMLNLSVFLERAKDQKILSGFSPPGGFETPTYTYRNSNRFSRRELVTTKTDEKAIAAAAMVGERVQPNSG